jgi:hypothetical protein
MVPKQHVMPPTLEQPQLQVIQSSALVLWRTNGKARELPLELPANSERRQIRTKPDHQQVDGGTWQKMLRVAPRLRTVTFSLMFYQCFFADMPSIRWGYSVDFAWFREVSR